MRAKPGRFAAGVAGPDDDDVETAAKDRYLPMQKF